MEIEQAPHQQQEQGGGMVLLPRLEKHGARRSEEANHVATKANVVLNTQRFTYVPTVNTGNEHQQEKEKKLQHCGLVFAGDEKKKMKQSDCEAL
jgi:nicotinamidase-related amidase